MENAITDFLDQVYLDSRGESIEKSLEISKCPIEPETCIRIEEAWYEYYYSLYRRSRELYPEQNSISTTKYPIIFDRGAAIKKRLVRICIRK
ncbi:hypothetical protein HDV06_004314 [Boothiomyces sp. JEL0866]|nr:hypothetical protein HDV06_004314 [Boothiomyces sp. JEL0866]